MNKPIGSLAITLFAGFVAAPAYSANVDIEWQEPAEYSDIKSANESPKKFQERVTETLTTYFEDAAEDHLPPDHSLHLTITDVDLAGDVEYFFVNFPQGIRVLRDVYFPGISFTYELRNDAGTVIMSGEENIRDIGYQFSGAPYINDPAFNYEKRLIHDWFGETFG